MATWKPPAAGAEPRPQSADAAGWTILHDPVRGARRLRRDTAGRPAEWVQADGTRVGLGHDRGGSLRRLEAGDWFVDIEAPEHGPTLSIRDALGTTDLTFARGGRVRKIRRDGAELVLELDEQERPKRVVLPGSELPLRYEWDADGGCVIRAGDGAALLNLSNGIKVRRIALDDDVWLEEVLQPGRVSLSAGGEAVDAAIAVVLRLENMAAIAERRWSDGTLESFTRDREGRLSTWTCGNASGAWVYAHGHLVADAAGQRDVDAAGRVTALHRPDGSIVRYGYDACGRRISREDEAGRTTYAYDPLGALICVGRPDGGLTRCDFDGTGRRLVVQSAAALRGEHRDEYGRLWAVTDAAGRALHTYIWIGDRIAARLDGPVGSPVAEAYLTDPFGTPLIALVAGGEGWACRRCDAPPHGHTGSAERPGLFGHFADPKTGLIHCGARELDPELGLFLTPDPWHGGADDPRRWVGADEVTLSRAREHPPAGFHDYALCRFDPLGRADRDGHVSGGEVVLHIFRWMLLPTWGFPLTAVSLFFFEPLNLYMEVIGLIVWAFKAAICDDKSHPWGYHTIVKATGLLASLRQFTFAFGLNGFLPRVISGGGPGGDRAVTVGNVIWINRDELGFLGRPEVIEVQDIGAGAQKFNDDPTKVSALLLLASDSDGKQRLHGSLWTRGYGNAVRDRVPTGGGANVPSFADVASGGASAPGTLVLRQPVPDAVPVPRGPKDKEKLEVREYVRGTGDAPLGLAAVASQIWFALNVPKDTSFQKGDWVQVTAPSAPDPKPDPSYRLVRDILPADDHAAMILSRELPLRFSGAGLSTKLRLIKVDVTAAAKSSADWTAAPAGAVTTLSRTVPAPAPGAAPPADFPPDLAADGILRIVAATGSAAPVIAGLPAGAPEDTSFASIKALRVVLTLAPDNGGSATGKSIFRRRPAGDGFVGVVEKASEKAKIKLTDPFPSIGKDDLLVVSVPGVADPVFVRATDSPSNKVVTVDPALPDALVSSDGTAINLQRTEDTDSDDKAAVSAVSGADVTVTPPHGALFQAANLVRIDTGGSPALRRITAISRMEFDIPDGPAGTGSLTLTPATTISDRRLKKVDLELPGRFLKWDKAPGTTPPASLGEWPNKLLSIEFTGFPGFAGVAQQTAAFYVRWPGGARPDSFHPDFHRVWSLATNNTDQYVVLETPLPLVQHKDRFSGVMKTWWRVDGDDYAAERDLGLHPIPAGGLTFLAREFTASGTTRSDSNAGRVLAQEPELLVPEKPYDHDTHRRALIEHEIHHTVQCNLWGPLMTALPLPGLIMSVTDIVAASGNTIPDWMKQVDRDAHGNPPATADGRIDHNTELNPFQIVSFGGMMQLAWKYVILAPFLGDENLRHKIFDLDFNDFNKVFNPLSRLITDQLPQVDPHAPAGTRWLDFLGMLVSRALDLRSWTPFLGFVPLLLPDGAQNFIEQGASRASGDLYSTIVSANDRFNLLAKGRLFGSHNNTDANLHPGVGRIVRLLLFPYYRTERLLSGDSADRPGSPVIYRQDVGTHDPFTLEVVAGSTPMLFDMRLFSFAPAPAAADLTLEGPPPARAQVGFVRVAPGARKVFPTLRSLVPMPPRVNRTAGFYFIPAGQGQVKVKGYYSGDGDAKRDANTHVVTLTIEDEVLLGTDAVAWAEPSAVGAAPPTTTISRFQTEEAVLKVRHREDLSGSSYGDRTIDGMTLDIAEARITQTAADKRLGWKITMSKEAVPASRVRIYRTVPKDDPGFDLKFDDVPTLAGVRSYLDGITGDVFAVVRDFMLKTDPLPELASPPAQNWDQSFDLEVPIVLAQKDRAIAILPPAGVEAPKITRKGDGPGRGETWTIGPLKAAPAADAALSVSVTYGRVGNTVVKPFTLTRKAPPAAPH